MQRKVSIQFIGFEDTNSLLKAVDNVKEQKGELDVELNFCNSNKLISEEEMDEFVKEYGGKICADMNDELGILSATGEFIAIYKCGCAWSKEKLQKQMEVFDANKECTIVCHDVELLKENGYPIDQNVRNKYIKTLGFQEHRYDLKNVQKFDAMGFLETWMFRNLFLNGKERELYKNGSLDPKVALLALLIANGHGLNMQDMRLVSFEPDDDAYQATMVPKYSQDAVNKKYEELETLSKILKETYGIEIDGAYRLLHIANGAFNYLIENQVSAQAVNEYKAVFEKAYKEEYREVEPPTEEKSFFYFLRKKIRTNIAGKGNKELIPLIPYLSGTPAEKWIYSIRVCKNQEVKEALIAQFKSDNENALELIAKDKDKRRFLKRACNKLKRERKAFVKKGTNLIKRFVLWRMRKKGYSDYMSREWMNTVLGNLFQDKETPLKTKLWCYRRGFMPWRIHQYDLTEENFMEHLSDRDYMYLHQINNSYKKWIEDKMTFRLVLEPFKQHLPEYYFQIIQRDDKQILLRLPDCPNEYETTFDEMFRMLRDKGRLALKAASGTHGVGFYKMHYEDGKYYMNNKETTEAGIRRIINSFKSFYVVTEYINMHDEIKNIYEGSVNTIRIMMLNRDGHHPELMDAYMRIGSKKSGVTDNVAFGGVVCTVDLETGEYGNGMQIKDHKFINIERHPDTDVLLNGVIPNWELIKKGLIEISQYMCQLEYLGFDVVCTPEGFIILEVNSHQDLHRLRYYDQRVKDFFFYKLRRKERRYGIKRNY